MGQPVAVERATIGVIRSIDDRARRSGGSSGGATLGGLPLLARLPDLQSQAAAVVEAILPAPRTTYAGRLVNQEWSRWLLIGGGVLLAAIALLPWLTSGGTSGGDESESWRTMQAPAAPQAAPAVPMAPTEAVSESVASHRGTKASPPAPPAPSTSPVVSPDPLPVYPTAGADYVAQAETTPAASLQTYQAGPTVPLADRHIDAPPLVSSLGREPIEPGMAQLEGVIENPSLRTSYDPTAVQRY